LPPLPASLRRAGEGGLPEVSGGDPLAAALKDLRGQEIRIAGRTPVGGGCISRTSLLALSDGSRIFLKESSGSHPGFFRAEAEGLAALAGHAPPGGALEAEPAAEGRGKGAASAGASFGRPFSAAEWESPARAGRGVRVPMPLYVRDDAGSQFLLLEHIEGAKRRADFWEGFGRALALLHRNVTSERFGFAADNYIGDSPQENRWEEDWLLFFGEHRLRFQAELAARRGGADSALLAGVEAIVRRLPSLLSRPDRASLLHGDLWGGNFMVGADGAVVLIDPAAYFGHREADLAMTELFGGFAAPFYGAYAELWPLEPGYEERKDLYNLYHLLNHLNLFGGSYAGSVRSIVARYR